MPNRLSLLEPLFAVVLLGCGAAEATGTRSQPMTVTFQPATLTRTGTRVANGNLRCDADMVIVAHGTSDHIVTLQSLTSTFRDSAGVAGSAINASPADWFGVVTLKRDETATAHRQPTGPGPFSLTTSLTYADQFGTSKVTTFTLTCTA